MCDKENASDVSTPCCNACVLIACMRYAGKHHLTLKEGLLEACHSLEHRTQRLSKGMVQRLHELGNAVKHPNTLTESLAHMKSHLPRDLSSGMDFVYSAVRPPSPRLQDLPQQLQNVTKSLLQEEDEDRAVCPNTAVYRSLGAGAAVLDIWLHDVITKSVMWPVPRWPFYVFMAGAMSCLLLSATCHLLCCCSRHMATSIWRFDYAGMLLPMLLLTLLHQEHLWGSS
jgi:hypothetical protein